MVDVRAFHALVYGRSHDLAAVSAPPYDGIDDDQRQQLLQASPDNIVRIEAAEGGPPEAAVQLRTWREAGTLTREAGSDAVMYVYEQRFTWQDRPRRQRGVLLALAVGPWVEAGVLPHERVFAGPVADRRALLAALRTNVSPVYVLHESAATIGPLLDRLSADAPARAFTVDEVDHRLWPIRSTLDHDAISTALAGERVLMADGHHRYTAAAAHDDASPGPGTGHLLAFAVAADDGPVVRPVHREVASWPTTAADDLAVAGVHLEPVLASDDATPDELLALAQAHLAVTPAVLAVVISADGRVAALVCEDRGGVVAAADRAAAAPAPAALAAIDGYLVQHLLLDVLDVPDTVTDLRYTPDGNTAVARVRTSTHAALVVMRPVTPAEVAAVALAGALLPPKSTSFHPKPRTGLALRILDATDL